ncbi:hypothetical protein ACWGI0_11540 [Streptomyces sp. NPDC054802]
MPRTTSDPSGRTTAAAEERPAGVLAGVPAPGACPRRAAVVLPVLVLLATLAGCVGTSRTGADYEEKVANAAEAARSSVETARLVVTAVEAGKSPAAYTSRTLSDVESAVGTVSTQLGSVQPPTEESNRLRTRITSLLTECHSTLGDLRIAARDGRTTELVALGERLPALSARLSRFEMIRPT